MTLPTPRGFRSYKPVPFAVDAHHGPVRNQLLPDRAEGGIPLTVTAADGVPIAVTVHLGGGVPVFLVHGFGSSARGNWDVTGWLAGFQRAGVTTVTVDVRGHGRSGRPHDPVAYRLPIVLEDLSRVLATVPDLLGAVPQFDLVGYSMGGRLVGELITDPAIPVRRAVIGGYDGRPLFEGYDRNDLAAALAGEAGPENPSRRIAAIAMASRGNDLTALAALVDGLATGSAPLPVKRLAVPILVVAGERDTITHDTRRWAAVLPHGHHLLVPGRNHISVVTSAVFRAAALDFLS